MFGSGPHPAKIRSEVMEAISCTMSNIAAAESSTTSTSDEESSREYFKNISSLVQDMESLFLTQYLDAPKMIIEESGGTRLPLLSSYKTILLICARINSSLKAGDNQATVNSLKKLFPVYKTFYSLYKDRVEYDLRANLSWSNFISTSTDFLGEVKKSCLKEMMFNIDCFLECKDDDLALKLYNGYKKNSPAFNIYRIINGKYLHSLYSLFFVCIVSCVILSIFLRRKPQSYIAVAFLGVFSLVVIVVSFSESIKEIRVMCGGSVKDKKTYYDEEIRPKLQKVSATFGNTYQSFIKLIGLDPAANNDDATINAAIRKVLRQLHPDKPGGDNDKFIKFRQLQDAFEDGSLDRSGKESVTVLTKRVRELLDRVEESGMSKDRVIIQLLNVFLNKRAYSKVLNNHIRKVNAKIALCISVPIIFMISGLASALSFHYCGINPLFLCFAYSCIGIGFFLSFVGLYNIFNLAFVEKPHVSYLRDIVDNINEDSIHSCLDDLLCGNQAENTQYSPQGGDSKFPMIGDFLKYNLGLIISPILGVSNVECCSELHFDTENEVSEIAL